MFEKINRYRNAFITKICYLFGGCHQHNSTNSFILMFHDVCGAKTDTEKFVSNIDDFCEYIRKILEDRQACDLKELVEKYPTGRFAVTFDDGFLSVYEYVYPFMKKNKIPFTIFMTVDFIDKDGYLTLEQLYELDADPLCTIGSHTVSHPLLRKCENAIEEIVQSKWLLEKRLGHEVETFAYPYGSIFACSMKNIRQAKRAGYCNAFSAIDGYLNRWTKSQRFFLPRFNGDPLVKKYIEERHI